MAKSEHQKLKILYVMNMFFEKTDEGHGITMEDIQRELEENGINAERKSIYDDIAELRFFGLDIRKYSRDGHFYYNLAERDFDITDLRLLTGAVKSSSTLTHAEAGRLLKKLEGLASIYEAEEMKRG